MRLRIHDFGGHDAVANDHFATEEQPGLSVTVVHTTPEGTLAALKAAGTLATNLEVRLGLIMTEVVPFRLSIDQPRRSVPYLKRLQEELVAENEYLKSENEEFIRGAGVGEGGERTAGSLQLERQNERLKEALVRLRDITGTREAELKSEISALAEEIEQLTVIKGKTWSGVY